MIYTPSQLINPDFQQLFSYGDKTSSFNLKRQIWETSKTSRRKDWKNSNIKKFWFEDFFHCHIQSLLFVRIFLKIIIKNLEK